MIGQMDQRITLQREALTPDGAGGMVGAWTDFASDPRPWASVKARAVREAMESGRVNAAYMVQFTIWNRDDVGERDRIVWNGETYNIRGVMRTGGRDLRLVIEAERGAAT